MYQIIPKNFISSYCGGFWFVNDTERERRKKSVDRHIEYDDYFGTLATALDLTGQIMSIIEYNTREIRKINTRNIKQLEKLKEDLVYLQKNYKIDKK